MILKKTPAIRFFLLFEHFPQSPDISNHRKLNLVLNFPILVLT